jgi:hypothetical protein
MVLRDLRRGRAVLRKARPSRSRHRAIDFTSATRMDHGLSRHPTSPIQHRCQLRRNRRRQLQPMPPACGPRIPHRPLRFTCAHLMQRLHGTPHHRCSGERRRARRFAPRGFCHGQGMVSRRIRHPSGQRILPPEQHGTRLCALAGRGGRGRIAHDCDAPCASTAQNRDHTDARLDGRRQHTRNDRIP